MEKVAENVFGIRKESGAVSIMLLLFGSPSVSGCQKNVGKLPLLYEQSDWQRMDCTGMLAA
jgi:hypothetical protein